MRPHLSQSHAQKIAPRANLIDNESAIVGELRLLVGESPKTMLTLYDPRFYLAKEAWANPPLPCN